jgi:DNA-binding response OmpR family regulator
MLLEAVWDYHFDPQTNVIDVHISRPAPEDRPTAKRRRLLHTVRGAGYDWATATHEPCRARRGRPRSASRW